VAGRLGSSLRHTETAGRIQPALRVDVTRAAIDAAEPGCDGIASVLGVGCRFVAPA
jgi:hypothetical protein